MTARSVILGLLGTVCICGLTFFNDRVLHQTHMIGNSMPVSVYGLLILFLLLIGPRLKRLALSGAELAVVVTLILAACPVPGSGLLRSFTSSLIMPHHYNRTEPGWKDENVLDLVPERMLADVSRNDNEVIDGFRQGLSVGDEHIPPGRVPWYAWARSFWFWIPIVLTLWFAMVGLSLVLHRQWSQHEHLPYPIATFTNSLLPGKGGENSGIFRSRLFWVGALLVLAIHLNNFGCLWFPDYLVSIRRSFDFGPLHRFFPAMVRGGGYRLLTPVVYFTVIGIAFFIPTDVSLAFGVGPFLWATVIGVLANYGILLDQELEGKGWYISLKPKTFVLFGANVGVFLALLYTGRYHLRSVFRRAAGFATTDEVTEAETWGARAFVLLMAVFVWQMTWIGIDWQLGVGYAVVLVIFYVVMSRLIAETGLFYIQPFFFPCVVLWGMVGINALGVRTLLLLQMLSMVLVIDPRESLMPFMVNNLKLLELRKQRLGRMAGISLVSIALGLAVALPISLYIQYDQGSVVFDGWADGCVPKFPFDNAVALTQRLESQGLLETAGATTGWARFSQMQANPVCTWAMMGGLVLVLIFTTCRLRFPWWPLHPLLFVTWATEPIWRLCGSFLIGWVIKVAVTKYGGSRLYNRLKPLMIGLIAGEILGAVFPSIVGAVYYLITREPPKSFLVLPG